MLTADLRQLIHEKTMCTAIRSTTLIQQLWSGYGQLLRCELEGGNVDSIIVKHITPPTQQNHPRGWSTNRSHQRKLTSYEVESAWYSDWSAQCVEACRIPQLIAQNQMGEACTLLLEDLNAAGFPKRLTSVSDAQFKTCIRWLASFHKLFMGHKPDKLWTTGTYWHLDTRPDELEALTDTPLKNAAKQIDELLQACPYQTIVHGDAKLANFCFSETGNRVAAVDFQYVGGGCGMKDLAYFVGSCLDEHACEKRESEILDCYFEAFHHAKSIRKTDPDAIEKKWRALYHVAWADFHRFLKGWSPGHWKINSYSERVTRDVIKQLNT